MTENNRREQVLETMKQEGDHHDFINGKSGYACLLRRSPTTGAWCGYVELPKDHPLHDLDYTDIENMDDIEIDVHGGITFSERGVFGFDCSHYGDYYPMVGNLGMMGDFATNMVDMHERAMGGDKMVTYKDKDYVIKEVNSLAEQFYKYKDMVIPKRLGVKE